jgi:hypothetical protein
MDSKKLESLKKLTNDIVLIKHRAGELGMFKTMHALESAVTEVGWEMADYLEGKAQYIDKVDGGKE